MRSAMSSAVSMSCSIITTVVSRGIAGDQRLHRRALLARQPGERLVEQQHARLLRQRHGDLHAALLAVGHLGDRPLRQVLQPDALQAPPSPRRRTGSAKRAERVPAQRAQAEERQRDVVLERVLREERDDLVGAREAAGARAGGSRGATSPSSNSAMLPASARQVAGDAG